MMNCTKFEIWISQESEKQLSDSRSEYLAHIEKCIECKRLYHKMSQSFSYMDQQKNLILSEPITGVITSKLAELLIAKASGNNTVEILSRVAAAVVIVVGLATGAVAGNFLSKNNLEETDPWSSEFSLLTNNENIDYYLFD